MSGEAWLYLFAVLINAVNLFLQVFFTIMYSDLEWYALLPGLLSTPSMDGASSESLNSRQLLTLSASDYINPIDLCNRLNTYIIPEAAVHAFLTFLFLINGYWLALILNLPLLLWNAKKYVDPCNSTLLRREAGPMLTTRRIFENSHLLDATEIFRKLNVHKKVRHLIPAAARVHMCRGCTPANNVNDDSRNRSSSWASTSSCSSSTSTP